MDQDLICFVTMNRNGIELLCANCQLKNYKKTPKKLIQVFQHVNYSQGGMWCENKYLKHKIRMKHL